jgi:predicted GNAT family N-acyltransferase
MWKPAIVSSIDELQQILLLQQQNLIGNIDDSQMKSQGFLTVHHDLAKLEQMHRLAASIIIKDNDKVVAYALTMLVECRRLIPELTSMFELFDTLSWQGKPLNDYRFYVMGQVCVAEDYRGEGLFEQLYLHHKKIYGGQFELLVTEISMRNQRSLRAHEKVGFKSIHTHRDNQDDWRVVGWNWQ